MLKTITITNYLGNKVTYSFNNLTIEDESGMFITGIEGLGPVKANINMTELSTSDGGIYNSSRLSTRNIVVHSLFTYAKTIEEARLMSYKFFPIGRKVNIVITTDTHILSTEGYVESNEPDIFSENEGTQISILCPDPLLYSAGEDGETITVFNGVDFNFEFAFENETVGETVVAIPGMNPNTYEIVSELPETGAYNLTYFLMEVVDTSTYYDEYRYINNAWMLIAEKLVFEPEIEMGIIENYKDRNIPYAGDLEIGVIIQIHALGAVTNLAIYNTGTREVMRLDTDKIEALTGYGIIAGDDITISTIKGDKYVMLLREGLEYNILNALDKNSDWFQLSKGDNVFTYTAATGSEYLQFQIKNRVAYEGV